jgi:TRAP-type C4-dicarboxylate transport system substrate-binding protein
MNWAPLLGGVVVSTEAWNKIPADMRKKLEEIAVKIGEKMQADIDKADNEALQIMQTYGLKVSNVPQNVKEQWKTLAEKGVKTVIGTTIEPQSHEQVKKHLENYRSGNK